MEILVTTGYIIVCILLFSLAIAIHEAGHLVAALLLGLRVERFSIGFGAALWKKKIRGVEYRISAIPFGGYVMIPDLDPEGTKALEGGSDEPKAPRERLPPWKEIVVAFAGPAMNVVLALVLAVVLSLAPGAKFGETPPVVGEVVAGGPAAKAGIAVGDRVLSVGGRPVDTWTGIVVELQLAGGRETLFELDRNGEKVTARVTPIRDSLTGGWFMLARSIADESASRPVWMASRGVGAQLRDDASQIFRILKGLVTPKEMAATGKALGGPVFIAEQIYRQVRNDFWDGIGFLRFLNVNLAVLNLLPIPVLDGGIILFALIALLARRRVPQAVVDWSTKAFMILLLALMGLLVVRDVGRSWRIHTYDHKSAKEKSQLVETLAGEDGGKDADR